VYEGSQVEKRGTVKAELIVDELINRLCVCPLGIVLLKQEGDNGRDELTFDGRWYFGMGVVP